MPTVVGRSSFTPGLTADGGIKSASSGHPRAAVKCESPQYKG